MMRRRVLVLLAALLPLAASAAVYRWVDAEGRVHYTDKLVENAEPVKVDTGQPGGAEPSPEPTADAALTPEQLAQKKAECEQKQKQIDSYKNAAKIVETDSLGRQHEYSPDERQLLVKKTQEQMRGACAAAGITLPAPAPAPAPEPRPQGQP